MIKLNDTNRWLAMNFIMIGFSLALSITLSYIFPFYIALPIMIGVFIGINFFIRKRMLARPNFGGSGGRFGYESKMSFVCIACGKSHKQSQCPSCGSKLRKASYE